MTTSESKIADGLALLSAAGYAVRDSGTGITWHALLPGETELQDIGAHHNYEGYFLSLQELLKDVSAGIEHDVSVYFQLREGEFKAQSPKQQRWTVVNYRKEIESGWDPGLGVTLSQWIRARDEVVDDQLCAALDISPRDWSALPLREREPRRHAYLSQALSFYDVAGVRCRDSEALGSAIELSPSEYDDYSEAQMLVPYLSRCSNREWGPDAIVRRAFAEHIPGYPSRFRVFFLVNDRARLGEAMPEEDLELGSLEEQVACFMELPLQRTGGRYEQDGVSAILTTCPRKQPPAEVPALQSRVRG